MVRVWMAIAALLAGLAVAAGAFATHALRARLSERSLEIFATGAQYQMYHALALLLVAVLLNQAKDAPLALTVAGYAFVIGITIFSGSLYALSLTGMPLLGAITPIGGLALLVGWLCVAIAAWNFR